METLTQKTIKIGNVTVGLLGLEIALVHIAGKDVSEEEAVNYLFEQVSKKNYIPKQAEEPYKEALLQEYRRYCKLDTSKDEGITIKVLGRPCIVCNKLKLTLIDILQEKNVAADIEDIQDLDEIWRYGVINTPTLIINGEVKSAGIQPPRVQLEKWIDEAVED